MQSRSYILKARLAEARKQLVPPVSAAELGRRLMQAALPGFKAAHVSSLELGYRYATWTEVEALAKALNVDPYWLASRPRPAPAVPRAPEVVAKAAPKPVVKPRPVTSLPPVPVRPVVAPPAPAPGPPAAPPDLAPAEIPVLVPGAEVEFRRQMVAELARTLEKLGDFKLKPFEWRSWREHEKRIRAAAVGLVNLPD